MTTHSTKREELLPQLRWITSNQLEETDYKQILDLIEIQVREARIDELEPFLDKRITMVQTHYRYTEKRLAELQRLKDGDVPPTE